jgi:uncharacterized protein YbcI
MSAPANATETPPDSRGTVLADVSRAMVQLHKDQFGRGPTKAQSRFAGPDILVCVLEAALTPAERNMAELGEGQRVRETRLAYQAATAATFRETVEAIVGRKIRAFMSAIDVEAEVAMEMFVLESSGDFDESIAGE